MPSRRRSEQWQRMAELGYITLREAARRARRSYGTMKRWCDDGFVESDMIGKTRYVKESSLRDRLGPLMDVAPSGTDGGEKSST